MYHLRNDELEVTILDPVEDRDRFGTRYSTGGYIFQITDHRYGDLLSGPTYPDSFNTFDGQGIPDSFSRSPLRDPTNPSLAVILGIGLCDLTADRVVSYCDWDVLVRQKAISMRTRQSIGNYALEIDRRIELHGRTVRSTIWINNEGSVGFPITWYPHPFFPQPDGNELCRLNVPIEIRENLGYRMSPSGFIARQDWPWTTDYYLALDHNAHAPITILQRHPKVGLVAGSFGYVPRFFPIWGNPRTFSWEPYFENTIAPGQELAWWMAFDV